MVDPTPITFQQCAGYLRITCSGQFPADNLRRMLAAVKEEAAKAGVTRLLFDLINVAAPQRELQRFDAGAALAEFFGPQGYWCRVGVIGRREHINKFGENVAVNRGLQMLVDADEARVLEWLLKA